MISYKDKSKEELCQELAKQSYEMVKKERKLQNEIKNFLFPLLTILEEDDIPVEKVWWDCSLKCIDLAPEVYLSPETLQRIIEELGVSAPYHEFRSDSSVVCFPKPIDFSIYNGKGFCKIKKTVKVIEVPATERETAVWELDGPCPHIEALEEVIGEGKEDS